jgi:hypothetical protein
VPSEADGSPTAKAQRNFTDPESRIMVDGDGAFVQAYNAPIVVDDATQVTVAQALTNPPPDAEHALPLLALTRDNGMAHRLGTPDGSATYRRRKAIVEPVFGQIKEARRFRRFSLRGTHKARGEWAFVCAAHNLGKLFRFRRTVTTPS